MTTNISCKRDFASLRLYINGLLHLEIPMNGHNGLQSWIEGSNKYMYFIQLYRKEGQAIRLEYDDKEIWESVLKLIDENL